MVLIIYFNNVTFMLYLNNYVLPNKIILQFLFFFNATNPNVSIIHKPYFS